MLISTKIFVFKAAVTTGKIGKLLVFRVTTGKTVSIKAAQGGRP